MEEKKIKYTIAGHEFVLQDQIAQTAGLVQGMKDFVGTAVAASPPASLAWAGVCVILPILTNPSAAEQANSDGFTYVTSRMRFYVALEPLLLPKDQDQNVTIPKDLKAQFESNIVELYQHILDFQLKSVLRFYGTWLAKLGRDVIQYEDWKGMLSEVQKREKIVDVDFMKINDSASRKELVELNKNASGSLETMQQLLLVAARQLRVAREQRDIAQESLQLQKYNLPIEDSALYGSAKDQHIPPCQEGTREGILGEITVWANADESETIFWLHGPAGTGKSAISRTIARNFAKTGQLGASYFFKRPGRSASNRFFPTIAARLVDSIPPLEDHVCKSLDEFGKLGKTKIEEKALEQQFQALILTPLQNFSEQCSDTWTKVIVIDALDECEDDKDIRKICDLLLKLHGLRTVRLRVFLTSRYVHPIFGTFKSVQKQHYACRRLSLLEDFVHETKDDIFAYLRERFHTIKDDSEITEDPWPTPEDLHRLLTLATTPSPLFIYASTLCLFVEDRKREPTEQLELWLQNIDGNASQFNQIYLPIIRQVLFDNENPTPLDSNEKSQALQILGSIILLAIPLPAPCLAALLKMKPRRVSSWLKNFRAVLNVPDDDKAPVEILHKSFSDFLLGDEGTGTVNFRVNAVETHTMLASKCIQRMTSDNGLRKDICDIREPGKSRAELDKAVITCNIPPDLDYSCLYWVYHLQHSGQRITDGDEVYTFLYSFFLYWLEALSLTGRISQATGMIDGLLTIVDVRCILVSRPYMY
jgi:hypothetical protein